MNNRKIYDFFLGWLCILIFSILLVLLQKKKLLRFLYVLSGHVKFFLEKNKNDKTNLTHKLENLRKSDFSQITQFLNQICFVIFVFFEQKFYMAGTNIQKPYQNSFHCNRTNRIEKINIQSHPKKTSYILRFFIIFSFFVHYIMVCLFTWKHRLASNSILDYSIESYKSIQDNEEQFRATYCS